MVGEEPLRKERKIGEDMNSASVMFVCLGNICRSPTAHGVFESIVKREGLEHVIHIESSGTSGWHIGAKPDERTMAAANRRGYELSHLRGRQFEAADFEHYDYVLAMDESNLSDLMSLKPKGYTGHVGLFLDFSQQACFSDYQEVPDPYYGGGKGFELVLDLVEDACEGLLQQIKAAKK